MSLKRWLRGLVVDLAKSLAIVAVVSAVLFAYSGVWPPLVVVQSGSMEPNMYKGDVVLVRAVEGTGPGAVNTYRGGGGEHFGMPGDVVVYSSPEDGRASPIIHRAMYWVDEGERIDGIHATTSGYVTKGDANSASDQRIGITTSPVEPEWIRGRAVLRVPLVGYVRLALGKVLHL